MTIQPGPRADALAASVELRRLAAIVNVRLRTPGAGGRKPEWGWSTKREHLAELLALTQAVSDLACQVETAVESIIAQRPKGSRTVIRELADSEAVRERVAELRKPQRKPREEWIDYGD